MDKTYSVAFVFFFFIDDHKTITTKKQTIRATVLQLILCLTVAIIRQKKVPL